MPDRIQHIDWMKGIAILCMVQVHTAAAMPLSGVPLDHPLALLAAAIGGMAAPLFVTMSGYGVHISAKNRDREFRDWVNWALPRIGVLVLCQLLVNLIFNVDHGGRFKIFTPGILTLFAISTMLMPIITRLNFRTRTWIWVSVILSPLILSGYTGEDLDWYSRITVDGPSEFGTRLILNGTYPALPWLAYIVLGTLLSGIVESRNFAVISIFLGSSMTLATLLISLDNGVPWAMTEGPAVLTFFPANESFLVVSMTILIIVKVALGRIESSPKPNLHRVLGHLAPAGRMSLSIYVTHFVVLGLFVANYDGGPITMAISFCITILHTLVWIPIAIVYEKRLGWFSFENLIRTLSLKLSK